MGRYINWADVLNRYSQLESSEDASDTSSYFITYAEGFVESTLGVAYTIPFSNNNTMIKDLCIDICYGKMEIGDLDKAKQVMDDALKRMKDLRDGEAIMVDDDGTVIEQTGKSSVAWSTGIGHAATFNTLDSEDQAISESKYREDYDGSGQ